MNNLYYLSVTYTDDTEAGRPLEISPTHGFQTLTALPFQTLALAQTYALEGLVAYIGQPSFTTTRHGFYSTGLISYAGGHRVMTAVCVAKPDRGQQRIVDLAKQAQGLIWGKAMEAVE